MERPQPLPSRAGFVALACALSVVLGVLFLTGCSSGQPEQQPSSSQVAEMEEPLEVTARPSAYVEILDDRLFWRDDEALWTARVEDDGSLAYFQQLGTLKDRIRGIAAYDGVLYLFSIEGIYRMDPDDTADEAELLVDEGTSDDLWVTSEGLFYLGDGTLSHASLTGSDETVLKEGVKDFVVADGKVYTLGEDGAFARCDLDGSNETVLDAARDRHDESVLVADGNDVYLVSSDALVCRDGAESAEEVGLSHEVGAPDRTVAYEGAIFYENVSEACYRHVDGEEPDEKLERAYFRGKPYARIQDGILYYTISGEDVTVMDLDEIGEHEEYVVEDEVAATSKTEIAASESTKDANESSGEIDYERLKTGSPKAIPESDYDIGAGLEMHQSGGQGVVTTDHFTLTLDGDQVAQGLWQVEQVDGTTIKFAYAPARQAGFDGTVFTLKAYDWGDNSYADIPATQMAGQSGDKKYVVIFPTDVRYDPSSTAQAEQYGQLRSWAEGIDMNANHANNPFRTVRP